MTRPAPGLMTFHRGNGIELLYLVGANREGQVWRVRPIFSEDTAERDELIRTNEVLRPIHGAPTQK